MNRINVLIGPLVAAFWGMMGCGESSYSAPAERTNVVTMGGKPVTLVGSPVKAGDMAPAFTAVKDDLSTFQFVPGDGRVWILSAVPSLDTPVCSRETHRFNQEASGLGSGVSILTISMDLPFAQKRWCGAEGVMNLQTVSDYRDRSFGRSYGVMMKETGLLARSVFVVGKDGRITHVELVSDITHEPNYDAALAAAREAVKQ